ncbi:MAG: hypothetical protein KF749_03145 [Bacteroidetes bacterium]|nr:hypothetical protein [Bacteroidota bacterium]MCW5895486.1 hypothetical protein [Bacteroidota bacterium]
MSLHVSLIVNDENDRGHIYQLLNDHPSTTIVIEYARNLFAILPKEDCRDTPYRR